MPHPQMKASFFLYNFLQKKHTKKQNLCIFAIREKRVIIYIFFDYNQL
jgi:hypothetical protein